MAISNYADLAAWQKAMDVAETVYRTTSGFPKEEMYGLRSQLRKAATSVPSNIVEGQGRRSGGAFAQHLSIAHGSLREVETQILLAARLGYLGQVEVSRLLEQTAQVGRLITGLSNSLRPRGERL